MPMLLKPRKKQAADTTTSSSASTSRNESRIVNAAETNNFQPLVQTRKPRKSTTVAVEEAAATTLTESKSKKVGKRTSTESKDDDDPPPPSTKRQKSRGSSRARDAEENGDDEVSSKLIRPGSTKKLGKRKSDEETAEEPAMPISKRKSNAKANALVERNDSDNEDIILPVDNRKKSDTKKKSGENVNPVSERVQEQDPVSSDDDDDLGGRCISSALSSSAGRSSVSQMARITRKCRVDEEDDQTMTDTSQSLFGSPPEDDRRPGSAVSGQSSKSARTMESSFDPNDPDWLKFVGYVKDKPGDAHLLLASDLSSSGPALLKKLLYRCVTETDETSDQSKKLGDKYIIAVIRAILYLSTKNDNNAGVAVDLVRFLYTELRHFRTPVLYNISEHCLDYMKMVREDPSLPPRWIEIFGKIIYVLIQRGDIKHETDILDGRAYREYIVREMCSAVKWTSGNAASLIAVMREIPGMEDTEFNVTMFHIKSFLKDVEGRSFPPIVYQLIFLAGSRRPSELLTMCAEYFEGVDFGNVDSMEISQKRKALGNVVFHFLEAAAHCEELVKAVVKIVKASFYDFGDVMSPCILSIVLGLTAHEHARNAIIDPLRNSVMKAFHSLHLSETSYWYRHKVGILKDSVTEAFKMILENQSSEDLECMFGGIRELGIGLLNADLYQSRYPNTKERCQKLGTYLLTTLAKKCSDKADNDKLRELRTTMNALLKITSRSIVHTECLAKILEKRTRQIIHPTVIGKTCDIIRHLPLMDSTSATILVKALSNALNLSGILMDQLMLILRKTIWKSVEARRTCAKIMIILLSNSRVVGEIPFSQYSESQRFYMDSQNPQQSSSNISDLPDNQPLCLEMLNLAKRCFSQQCEIREQMYLGFHSIVRKNPELCELICMHLYNHSTQYFRDNLEDQEVDASTLLLGKIIEWPANNTGAIFSTPLIKEELGFLVQSLGFVVNKSHQAFHSIDDGPPHAVQKLEELLQQWIKIVLKMSPTTIEIAASEATVGAGGGSRPLDSVRYVETIFAIQIMQVIEALIEYLNLENNSRNGKTVKKLFEKHSQLEQILKKEKEKASNTKKGKGGKDKKSKASQKGPKDTTVDDEVTIVDDAASETSENPGAGVKFKKPDAPKKLYYYHIITLESILDMLQKLQKGDEEKAVLGEVECETFERFLISVLKQKFTNFKKKESLHERRRPIEKVVETFADIAGCIWNGLLLPNLEEVEIAGTSELTELRLEVVNDIVTLLSSSYQSICGHLIKVFSDDDTDNSYDVVFPKFFKSWESVFAWIPKNSEDDKILQQHLFDILLAFSKALSPDGDNQDRAAQVLNWIWKYMSSASGKHGKAEFLLADSVVACWLAYYMKGRDFLEQPGRRQHDVLTLAMGVKQVLGVHREADTQHIEDSDQVTMWIINEETAPTILCAIMGHIEIILEHITAVLAKLKCNQNDEATVQNKIGLLRGSCFTKIEEIISVCSELVSSGFPACLCCITMLKVVPQIFTVMTGFGEYFSELIKSKRLCSLKGFAKPVSRIAKEFKPLVESMITHVERVQREYADDVIRKKASTNKKNKGNGTVPQAIKNQLVKEKRLIPNFVYLIEKYDQQIIELSKKSGSKNKLLVGMKLSTAHDFKIDTKKFTEATVARARTVQEITTVPDEESMEEVQNENSAVRAPKRTRVRKARKRKSSETDGNADADVDEQ